MRMRAAVTSVLRIRRAFIGKVLVVAAVAGPDLVRTGGSRMRMRRCLRNGHRTA